MLPGFSVCAVFPFIMGVSVRVYRPYDFWMVSAEVRTVESCTEQYTIGLATVQGTGARRLALPAPQTDAHIVTSSAGLSQTKQIFGMPELSDTFLDTTLSLANNKDFQLTDIPSFYRSVPRRDYYVGPLASRGCPPGRGEAVT